METQKYTGKYTAICIIILVWLLNPAAVLTDTTMQAIDSLPDTEQKTIESDSVDSAAANKNIRKQDRKPKYSQIADIKSFWELTKLGGRIRWAIFLVLAIGIALIVQKLVALFLENRRSRLLLNQDSNSLSIEKLATLVKESPKNSAAELFSMLLEIFQTTGKASVFHEEIANYINFQQDRFGTFRGRINFFSDTAGALGLVGTVWGMFQTFFGGNMDKQLILNGMGIALITTLMGLVVSIILNFFSTEIFTVFNKQLEKLQIKADEFRIRFLEIEQRNYEKSEAVRIIQAQESIAAGGLPSNKKLSTPIPQKKMGPPHTLIYISGDDQAGIVNQQLQNEFVVELLDANRNRLPDQLIRFAVNNEQGYLANGGKAQEITTDSQGRASTFLTLGTRIGNNIVKASAAGLNGKYIEFKAIAKADSPTSLVLLDGNNQNSPAGSVLKKPFVVGVRDSNDNPIPNFHINFKISMGNGSFAGGNSKLALISDNNGEAQAFFTLGKKPGFNRVVVTAKKLRRAKLEFQVLGQ